MGVPQHGCFISWKIQLKWVIWGYPHFRKPPYSNLFMFGQVEQVVGPQAVPSWHHWRPSKSCGLRDSRVEWRHLNGWIAAGCGWRRRSSKKMDIPYCGLLSFPKVTRHIQTFRPGTCHHYPISHLFCLEPEIWSMWRTPLDCARHKKAFWARLTWDDVRLSIDHFHTMLRD